MSVLRELPFVSVVVPVRNGARTIARCIEALLAGDYPEPRREILVVDNGSTDETAALVDRYPVRRILEPVRGRSQARNRGVREAGGQIVAFIDADCIAAPDWLSRLVAGFERDEIWGVAGEIFAFQPATPAERFMAQRDERWQAHVLSSHRPFAITANVAFRRATFDRVGLFDPEFVTAEDVDFGWRFFALGDLELRYEPEAVVYHSLRPTARELFRQQAGLGYGRATLRARYGLPRGYSLGTWADLRQSLVRLVRNLGRGRGDDELAFAAHDVLRRVALRVGALRWALSARRWRRG